MIGPSFKFDQMYFEDVVVGEHFIIGETTLSHTDTIFVRKRDA